MIQVGRAPGHQGKQQKQDREGGDAALGSMDCGTSSAAQIILDTYALVDSAMNYTHCTDNP